MTVAIPVVLLAAGGARRFGSDKLLATVAGRPLLAWTLDLVRAAVPADQVLAVVGPGHEARTELLRQAGVEVRFEADAERGMGWSLAAGLGACPPLSAGAVIVLADDPLAARALPMVHAAASRAPDTIVAVRREPFLPHPVYLPRDAWPPPPQVDDDLGLRAMLGADACWVEDPGPRPVDIDAPADVERLATDLRSQ